MGDPGPITQTKFLQANTAPTTRPTSHPSPARGTLELIALLAVGILIARVFVAEPYAIPTGSMAPTLLGNHLEWRCPNCGMPLLIGRMPDQSVPDPLCGNCGNRQFANQPASQASGDRVLVQKMIFDFRKPARWEPAVFWNPESPREPFVKRIVGLPGESLLLRDGDVWVDGIPARKSIAQQRALRQLVYHHDHRPADYDRYPRWVFRSQHSDTPPHWISSGTRFLYSNSSREPDIEWLEYQHWQPDRMAPGPVYDFIPYDGAARPGQNRVDDLMLSAEIRPDSNWRELRVAIHHKAEAFEIRFQNDGVPTVTLTHNGKPAPIKPTDHAMRASRPQLLEVSTFDQQLLVALDGILVFEPFQWHPAVDASPLLSQRIALGAAGGSLTISHLRVDRDIYYTTTLETGMRQAAGVAAPVTLGPDDFFALGDNSPVSNDSRFWRQGPRIRGESLLGKPFLVHVPGQSIPVGLAGHTLFWIPDFRRIRYIH